MKRRFSTILIMIGCLLVGLGREVVAEQAAGEKTPQVSMFLPFDFYTRHREELSLNEAQSRELERIGEDLREAARKLEEERRTYTASLEELMGKNPIDVEEAMKRFDLVLKTENALKALQFRNGILMRNTLRPSQLKQLQVLAAREGASRGAGIRAEFAERIQRLRDEIHKRTAGAPSPQVVERIKQIEQAAKDGRFSEAKTQLEKVLREVRHESPVSDKQPADVAPPSPEKK